MAFLDFLKPKAAFDPSSLMGSFGGQAATQASSLASSPVGALQQQLPSPPPAARPKASPFDKEHLSETLAGISQGFLSSPNFGEGLGAAMGSLGSRMAGIRTANQKSTTYGGPDNQFEIVTDADGNRTVREVPEFREAVDRARDAKTAPDAKVRYDMRSRALNGISKLPKEEQAAAYQDLLANPQAYGVDPRDLRTEWTPAYGTVGGNMGLTVDQDRDNFRGDRMTDSRVARNDAATAQGAQRLAISERKDARAAAKGSGGLPKAPPRKGYSRPSSRAEFDQLPRGSKFIAPDGSYRIKQ